MKKQVACETDESLADHIDLILFNLNCIPLILIVTDQDNLSNDLTCISIIQITMKNC